MTNSDDTNILRILQDLQGLNYDQARVAVVDKIHQKEQDFISAGTAVINHSELGGDPQVCQWISCLPYVMGGNVVWSQEVRTTPSISLTGPNPEYMSRQVATILGILLELLHFRP